MDQAEHTDDEIKSILSLKKVAVMGMSKNSSKAAYYVPKYLSDNGYDVMPVNPTANEILGQTCYESISDVPHGVEIIDVFRPSDQVMPFVKDAIKEKPKVIWLQEGIHNTEAEELARKEGITVIFN